MIPLTKYIFEKLTDAQIEQLNALIPSNDNEDVSDIEFNNVLDVLQKHYKAKAHNKYYEDFSIIFDKIHKRIKKNTPKSDSKKLLIVDEISNDIQTANIGDKTKQKLINILKYKIETSWGKSFTSNIKNIEINNTGDNLIDWLDDHGLSTQYIKWGSQSPVDIFINIFGNKIDNFINQPRIKWSNIKPTGNIINDYCEDFKKECKEILNINYPKSKSRTATVGTGEILLKTLIENATSGEKGDVVINDGETAINIEVKDGSRENGGRPSGQDKQKAKPLITSVDTYIYKYFRGCISGNKNEQQNKFYEIQDNILNDEGILTTKNNVYVSYFQKEKCEKLLNKLIKNIPESSVEGLLNTIVDGVLYQYNINDNNIEKKLKNAVNQYYNKKYNENHEPVFIDILGFLELYCYLYLDKDINYLFVVKSGYKDDASKYVIFDLKNNGGKNSIPFNIDNVLTYLRFGYTSSGDGRESTARIILR